MINLKEEIMNTLMQIPEFTSAMETKTKEEQDAIYSDIESLAKSFQKQLDSFESIIPKTTS